MEGYYHSNEAAWGVVEGNLAFLTAAGEPSTVFNRAFQIDGKLVLEGDFVLHPEMQIVHQLHQIEEDFQNRPRHDRLTARHMAAEAKHFGWSIGDHTYGVPAVVEKAYAHLSIGKFCSIADGVIIILANHRIDGATTYPFASLKKYWPSLSDLPTQDHSVKGDVIIGNDVWIGYGATILSGITIGDGAVIAARSVVTKDVPPFAVYGGNPGKVLKYRHSDEDIAALSKIQWWNWTDEVLNERLPLMMEDLQGFIARYAVK